MKSHSIHTLFVVFCVFLCLYECIVFYFRFSKCFGTIAYVFAGKCCRRHATHVRHRPTLYWRLLFVVIRCQQTIVSLRFCPQRTGLLLDQYGIYFLIYCLRFKMCTITALQIIYKLCSSLGRNQVRQVLSQSVKGSNLTIITGLRRNRA